MNKCPITYEFCEEQKYSVHGLRLLSQGLKHLEDFPFMPKEQIERAMELASKLSIQGVQPKMKKEMHGFQAVLGQWNDLLERSFLSPGMKIKYRELLEQRWQRLR